MKQDLHIATTTPDPSLHRRGNRLANEREEALCARPLPLWKGEPEGVVERSLCYWNLKSLNLKLIHSTLRTLWTLWTLWTLLLTSCTLDNELQVCPDNVQIEYTCSDGTSIAAGDYPAAGIRQFVYDSTGLLVNEFRGDSCNVGIGSFHLPPGKYTIVTWVTTQADDFIYDNVTPDTHRLHESHLQALPLTLESRNDENKNISDHCRVGRLFHGQREFTVHRFGVSRFKMGLMHAHARLNLTIEWADGLQSAIARGETAPLVRVDKVPLGYLFTGGEPWGDYVLPCHREEAGKGAYATGTGIDNGKIKASVTTLRFTDECHPTVHLTRDGEDLMTPVDLSQYFKTMNIGLTNNIRQEFNLTIQIGKNQTLVFQTNISGWEDGGSIGTN